MKYVIRCVNDHELLWSNDEGYTDSDNFEIYSFEETKIYHLPIEGEWIELVTL
jgi:hypothetical protein